MFIGGVASLYSPEELVKNAAMALVSGAFTYAYKKVSELQKRRIRLEADLSICLNAELIDEFGCSGIKAKIVSRTEHPITLTAVYLVSQLRATTLDNLEQGFQVSFGQSKNADVPSPRARVDLFQIDPGSEPLKLERDAAACFFLPVGIPILPEILRSPSESVQLVVELQDGTELVLKQGMGIQEMFHTLLEMSDGVPLHLNVPVSVNVILNVEEPPNLISMVGRTNVNPIKFGEQTVFQPPSEQRTAKIVGASQVLWNHWIAAQNWECQIISSRAFSAEDIAAAEATTFTVVAGPHRLEVTLIELLNLFDLLSVNFQASIEAEAGCQSVEIPVHLRDDYTFSEAEIRLRSLPITHATCTEL